MSTALADTSLAVAVDIGGTFTDIALYDAKSGQIWRAKTPSVPADPSQAFLTGVRLALEEAGRAAPALGRVLHGTTVATNMILEDKGARTALVTTLGFRHVLAIGRQDIPRRANYLAWVKPPRPVPASRVLEVKERIGAGGTVVEALDEASVQAAADACRKLKVEAVAVCLLHSFANPAHERRVAELLRASLPGVAVTASCDVLPVVREYERSLATVLNALVMPGVATYVSRLEDRLAEEKVGAPLLYMQSNGGVAGGATIRRAPALTALSGPAAGVVGARDVADACGIRDIITVDIGGTSADICLIKNGEIALTQHGHVGEWPLPLPMVDMVTIGAGGGSIAKVAGGTLTVGPQSAGAEPGPAAYGRGGSEATVTDAHVVLGHLPANLLGGRMALDAEAARRAIERQGRAHRSASPRGSGRARHSGHPRQQHDGGAAHRLGRARPRSARLHPGAVRRRRPAAWLRARRAAGHQRVLIPTAPGVLCADGLLAADLKADFSRTLPKTGKVDIDAARQIYAELSQQADDWLANEKVAPADRKQVRMALMRYHGQGGEVAVGWVDEAAGVEAAFAAAHRALYGFTLDSAIELVTLRIEATGRMPAPLRPVLPSGAGAKPQGHHTVHFASGTTQVPLFNRAAFGAGDRFAGPAIISQLDATTLVLPNWAGEVHPSGAILLTLAHR